MSTIVWTPRETKPGGSVAAADGLIATLRAVEVGQEVRVPGWTAERVGNYVRAARRGTAKWFASRTLTTGVRIVRVE